MLDKSQFNWSDDDYSSPAAICANTCDQQRVKPPGVPNGFQPYFTCTPEARLWSLDPDPWPLLGRRSILVRLAQAREQLTIVRD